MLRVLKIQILILGGLIILFEFGLRVIYFNLKSDNFFAISSFIGDFNQRIIGKVVVKKEGVPTIYDEILGYTYIPGAHPVHISHLNFFGKVESELKATETVDNEGYRITSKNSHYKAYKPEIWILGCSFSFGSYLNDNDTFPWIIQRSLKNYKVKNYSRGGFGQLQYLLQLEKLLKAASEKNNIPKQIILTYTPLHQERNIQSDDRLYRARNHGAIHTYRLPAGRINDKNELEIYYKGLSDVIDYKEMNPKKVMLSEEKLKIETTKAIFEKISQLAIQYKTKIIVAVLDPILREDPVLTFLHKKGYDILYMNVDFRRNKTLNLLPFDPHPNALANQKWAEVLVKKLKASGFS